jgi:periplasmic protein TonB
VYGPQNASGASSRAAYWGFGAASLLLHAVALGAVLYDGVLFDSTRRLSAQPVELVSLPSGVLDPLAPILAAPVPHAADPPPAAPEPEPAAPEPEPEPEPLPEPEPPKPEDMPEPNLAKIVKKDNPTPKPTPARRPTPKATPVPPKKTPAPAAPARPTARATPAAGAGAGDASGGKGKETVFAMQQRRGVPGGFESSGAMSFDNESFNFAYYGTSVQTKLSNNFFPPPQAFVAGKTFETTVFFVIGKNGELLESRVERSSGFQQLDDAAMRALLVSQPFPPLPVGFRGMELGVYMRFRCGQK